MINLDQRREIQQLRRSGQTLRQISMHVGVSVSSVKRISKEPEAVGADDASERRRRRIGRPSIVRDHEAWIQRRLLVRASIPTRTLLFEARQRGYSGSRSAFYASVAVLRNRLVESGPVSSAVAAPDPAGSFSVRPADRDDPTGQGAVIR